MHPEDLVGRGLVRELELHHRSSFRQAISSHVDVDPSPQDEAGIGVFGLAFEPPRPPIGEGTEDGFQLAQEYVLARAPENSGGWSGRLPRPEASQRIW